MLSLQISFTLPTSFHFHKQNISSWVNVRSSLVLRVVSWRSVGTRLFGWCPSFISRHTLVLFLCLATLASVHVQSDLTKSVLFPQCEDDGQIFFSLDDGNTKFSDLIQLVEFYQLNKGVLPCKLKHHCIRVALWPQIWLSLKTGFARRVIVRERWHWGIGRFVSW